MKTYIISGIEPAKKGAGRFIDYFIKLLKTYDQSVEIIYIRTPENKLVKILKNYSFFNKLKNLYYSINQLFLKFNKITDSKVIIFHPQSLGIKKTIQLITDNKLIYYYVLDNFFFCIRSYNNLDKSNSPCFLCLKDLNQSQINKCKSAPNKISYNEYVQFQDVVLKNLNKIIFLTQNTNQTNLLKLKFGDNIRIHQTGMNTGELNEFTFRNSTSTERKNNYDFLYHNTLNYAKGIEFFIALSIKMVNYTFVMPYDKITVEKILKTKIYNKNLLFIPCSWETGLKNLLLQTKVTIVPSLWSAPIEGALIKSLYYSENVAVLKSEYSFASEIPPAYCINLNSDVKISEDILNNYMINYSTKNDDAKKWVTDLMNTNEISIKKFIEII